MGTTNIRTSSATKQVGESSSKPVNINQNEGKSILEAGSEPRQKHPLDDPNMRGMHEEQWKKKISILAHQGQEYGGGSIERDLTQPNGAKSQSHTKKSAAPSISQAEMRLMEVVECSVMGREKRALSVDIPEKCLDVAVSCDLKKTET